MLDPRHLLIAIDDSETSLGAVRHAAAMLGGVPNPHVTLVHVLDGAPPPELREHRGAEDPALETLLDADLARRREEWLAGARAEMRFFDRAEQILQSSGVPAAAIDTVTIPTDHKKDVADRVIEAAHTLSCGTVVVGRTIKPWYQELLATHLSDELVAGDGVAVLVVP